MKHIMDKEWVDVVDNVVKIGLPSLITGFITIFGMKYSAKSIQNKFLFEHKVKLLEKISDDMDLYFTAWNMLYSKLGGITKKMDPDMDNVIFTKAQSDAIKDRDKKLTESWPLRQSSLAKLRLLKANKAVEKLSICTQIENDLRDLIIFDKNYPNFNQLIDLQSKYKESKKIFHKELADFYESIAS
jgi:hypothetical protein